MTRPEESPLLLRLRALNPTTVFLAALVVALAGLLVPGWIGGLILLAVVAGMAVLAKLTWRVTPIRLLFARGVILVLITVIAIIKVFAST